MDELTNAMRKDWKIKVDTKTPAPVVSVTWDKSSSARNARSDAASGQQPPQATTNGQDAADAVISVGSVWTGTTQHQLRLEILSRDHDTFVAQFTSNNGMNRNVRGTIRDGVLEWKRKDVKHPPKGHPGGDNRGVLSSDQGRYRLDFEWTDNVANVSGRFTLFRQ